MFWPNPKDIDTTDRYGVTIDPEWLGDENIVIATFTPSSSSNLTLTDTNLDAGTYSALFSGGSVGLHSVHLRVETPTRSLERNLGIWINDNFVN